MNSFSTMRVPSRLPTTAASRQGTPSPHATGANDPARGSAASVTPARPSTALTSATSAMKLISIAPTFIARCRPSLVPRPAASMMLTSVFSTSRRTVPSVSGTCGLGDEHLGHHERAGRRHDHRGQQVLRLDAEGDVCGHDAAGDVGHARGHHRHQLGLRHPAEIGANRQRRLGLAHENAGGDVQRLGAARAHHAVHHHREQPDHHLHQAEVVQDREQGGDEDDRRQDLKGEDDAVLGPGFAERTGHHLRPHGPVAQRAEHHRRADGRVVEQLPDPVPQPLERALAKVGLEHHQGEQHLQAEPPRHDASLDGATIRRERVGDA